MNALSKSCYFSFIVFVFLYTTGGCGREEAPKKPVPEIPAPPSDPDLPPRPEPKPEPPKVDYCVQQNVDYNKDGGYRVRTKIVGRIKIMEPVTQGCIRPIMTFSNGTGANLFFYNQILKRFASHGYYVSSYETPQSGSGKQALQAVEYAMKQRDVDPLKVISLGHSQGGQGSVSATYELEKKYRGMLAPACAIQPAFGMSRPDYARILPKIKSPVFAFHGSRDTTVPRSWVETGFKLIKSDKYWYEAVGSHHLNPHSWAATGCLSFANMVLLKDKGAKDYFLGLTLTQYWKKVYL